MPTASRLAVWAAAVAVAGGGFGLFYSGGSSGSTGGNGGAVQVTANGSILTHGNYAQGIFAQSIGGGGGDAGKVSGIIALGGDGAGGGNGGLVAVGNNGTITTTGLGANAIEVQSIGGTGGNGASSGGVIALGGKGSSTTVGGEVGVSNKGILTTMGAQAAGILAQSIGGGGGNGATAGGLFAFGGNGGSGANGGNVTVIKQCQYLCRYERIRFGWLTGYSRSVDRRRRGQWRRLDSRGRGS